MQARPDYTRAELRQAVPQPRQILNPQLDFSFFPHFFLNDAGHQLFAAANFRYYTGRTRFTSPGHPTSPRTEQNDP
jgi:hypothetical protein